MMNRIKATFGSIVVQVGLVVLVLTGLTLTAIVTGYRVFATADSNMAQLAHRHVPALAADAKIVDLSSELSAKLNAILIAETPEVLETVRQDALDSMQELTEAVDSQPGGEPAGYAVPMAAVRKALEDLAEARGETFSTEAAVNGALTDLSTITGQIGLKLVEKADDAYFSASVATEPSGPAVEKGEFPIADAAPGAGDTFRADISRMVDAMRSSEELGFAVRNYYASALEAALAEDDAELMIAQDRLETASGSISRLAVHTSANLGPMLSGLDRFAATSDGIVALRRANLAARAQGQQMSEIAAQKVAQIRTKATDSNVEILTAISDSSHLLGQNIAAAIGMLKVQMLASLVVVALALALVYLLIVRPLRGAVKATDMLARGDLAAVDGLHRRYGEIGLLVSALYVFRDGIVEKQRLEAEDRRQREQREIEARQAAEAERQREEVERQREIASQEQIRAREIEEASKREAIRQAAEAERQARATAQNLVVSALAQNLRRLADGDLRAQIDQEFEDGYEQLRIDFNAAVAALSGALGEIRNAADTIFANSDGISQAAEDLSRRTEQSAATLEQSAAALHQLTAAVTSAAQGSAEADRTVSEARKTAEDGDSIVRRAISAMGGISESSNRISRIIDVIDDIAFQTNLLALNAGVEAARAGEAGRGFAVVASEVRALSQRSSDAAREIGALITESVRQVGDGVDLVNNLGLALEEIVATVSHISQNVSGIASSAREQSSGISEINVAVGQLEQSTQQNAAMVEQTTAATQELREQALALTRTLAQFTLEADAVAGVGGNEGHLAA